MKQAESRARDAVSDDATQERQMKMRAARMYSYNAPLRIAEIPVPDIGSSGRFVIVYD